MDRSTVSVCFLSGWPTPVVIKLNKLCCTYWLQPFWQALKHSDPGVNPKWVKRTFVLLLSCDISKLNREPVHSSLFCKKYNWLSVTSQTIFWLGTSSTNLCL